MGIALCENATEIRAPLLKFQACSDFVDLFNFSERMGAHPKYPMENIFQHGIHSNLNLTAKKISSNQFYS